MFRYCCALAVSFLLGARRPLLLRNSASREPHCVYTAQALGIAPVFFLYTDRNSERGAVV